MIGNSDFAYFSREFTPSFIFGADRCGWSFVRCCWLDEMDLSACQHAGLVKLNKQNTKQCVSRSCPGGYHTGIGRAIYYPYKALINTLLLIRIPFLLISVVFYIGYLGYYVEIIFVAILKG